MKNQHNAKRKARATLLVSSRQAVIALTLAIVFTATMFVPAGQAFAESKKKPLAGKTISVMGDSISTYTGWSDKYPITDPSCTNRYGEAYYGPVGGDFHNTELLVTDTWWHQAATELGAEILMSNAGNSSGLFYASYPSIPAWDLYLKEMLAYKTRPYYMGRDGKSPDIIALYIGSADVRENPDDFGSVDDVDFDNLVTDNGDGTLSNITPTTVAESYCILMEKLIHCYPNAEIYCFAVVPQSAGEGHLSAFNQRLAKIYPFNDMVRDVAEHYGAHVVELPDQFNVDPDGDGVADNAAYQEFRQYYNDDPHPNAKGFDIITEAFVSAVLENSEYFASVETKGGLIEAVPVSSSTKTNDEGVTTVTRSAKKYTTPNGYTVNYDSKETIAGSVTSRFSDSYTSDGPGRYSAKGGREYIAGLRMPQLSIDLPLTISDDEETGAAGASNTVKVNSEKVISGDTKTSPDDGIYDYQIKESPKGSVSVRTSKVSVSEPVVSGSTHNMQHVVSDTFYNTGGTDLLTDQHKVKLFDRPEGPEDAPDILPGYDFAYIGSDQFSNFYSAHVYTKHMDGFANEAPLYSDETTSLYLDVDYSVFHDRGLVVPRLYLNSDDPVEFSDYAPKVPELYDGKKGFPARWDSIQQFTLADRSGKIVTTYCADQLTGAEKGFSYRIHNIEDAHYYNSDSAKMIRTIARNGYWGASSGYGSLAALKESMRNSGKFTEDDINALTDGIAMTATQYAIWTFSNKLDSMRYVNAYKATSTTTVGSAADKEDTDLIFKLYHYLINLNPNQDDDDKTTQDTLINSKNFIDRVSLTLKEKPADLSNNQDDNDTNDSYVVDISLTLDVRPLQDNEDNLIMKVYDGEQLIATGRIAGDIQEGEIQLYPDSNGKCTLENVLISEGGLENIRFAMSGTQNLKKDVYLYISENRNGETSQTMVGVSEGKRNVNVEMNLSFELDVDDELYTQERIWRIEKYKGNPPKPTPTPTPPPPPFNIPKTGDMPFWAAIAEFLGF